MPYNYVADIFHTKKFYSRLSSSEVRLYTENGRFAFVSPLWGLGATTMIILGSLESAYSGLPISVNLTFFRYVLRLRCYGRNISKKIGSFAPTGSV